MTTTITAQRPIAGPVWDKSKPETRQAWLDFRRPGITATMIRDWGIASRRRIIIDEKVTGEFEDLSHLPYVAHGNRREPVIAAWAQGKFGLTPTENTFAHPENARHLASPDLVSRDPLSTELLVGGPDAIIGEIKTSKHDLTPGTLDAARVLIDLFDTGDFYRSNYYTQIQWQMYVMNSPMTLFIYEQHDDIVDPETGTFTPVGPPMWAWIPRSQPMIDSLVENVAPKALAEIDAAMTALRVTDLPPVSDFPAEDALQVKAYLQGLDTESVARKSKTKAWDTLKAKYVGPGKEDFTKDLGFATITVSTSTPTATPVTNVETDWDAVRAGLTDAQRKKYDALVEKHTTTVTTVTPGTPTQRLTITAKKEQS